MALYTERHGIRKPIEHTEKISIEMYSLLFSCCEKYYNNLAWKFPLQNHCDFVNQDFIEFNKNIFNNMMKIEIPSLFKNVNNSISAPCDYDNYDQYALIDFIEFIAQNIKDINEGWNNNQYKNYWYISCLETSHIFKSFRHEINEIFEKSGLLFILTDEKIVERVIDNNPLTAEIEIQLLQVSEQNLQELVNEAISLFKTPNPAANKLAVEKIWDALENLKTYFVDSNKKQADQKVSDILGSGDARISMIFEKELSELGNIGNNYHIRHYNDKQVIIRDSRHYDYFFNRCLSLIALAIQYLK